MNKQLSFADAFSAELQSEIQRCDGIPTGDAFKLATLKAFKMSAGSALEEALCLMRKIKNIAQEFLSRNFLQVRNSHSSIASN